MLCHTFAAFIMWSEFRSSGILDDLVRWHSLSTYLSSLAFISACWTFVFPELLRPAVSAHQIASILQLAHVDMILEALTLVRVSLQIPANAFTSTSNPTANRYCRLSAFLLLCFLQRLVLQDNGYIPAFFEVLHFYKAALFRDTMFSSFTEHRHLRSLRARLPDLNAFLQDDAHFQQPCAYLRMSPWFMPYYIGATDHDVLHREHSRCRKFLQLQRNAINMPFLNLPLTTGDVRRTIGYTVPYPLKYKDPRIPFGHRRASGNIFYDRNLMLHGYTASFANWDIVTALLTSVVVPYQLQLRTLYTRNFADVYTHIYIVNYDLKLLMMFKRTTTCFTNWVQTQEHLLTPCVNYSPPLFHPHSYTIFFGWVSSSMSHSVSRPHATSP